MQVERFVPVRNLCGRRESDVLDLLDLVDREGKASTLHTPTDVFFTPAGISFGRMPLDEAAIDAEDLFFSEVYFFFFHTYKIAQIMQNARDFFTIMQSIFVDDFSNARFILQVGTLLEQRIA